MFQAQGERAHEMVRAYGRHTDLSRCAPVAILATGKGLFPVSTFVFLVLG